jgi:hypothetical protein
LLQRGVTCNGCKLLQGCGISALVHLQN